MIRNFVSCHTRILPENHTASFWVKEKYFRIENKNIVSRSLDLFDCDASISGRICIGLADCAIECLTQVIREDIDIDCDIVLNNGASLEHRHSVSGGFEHIAVGGKHIGLFKI